MKITKTKLKKIIQEEIKLILEYERYVYRTKDGELRIQDDDGYNDERYSGRDPDDYDHLEPGGEGETIVGTDDLGPSRADRADPGEDVGGLAYGDSRSTSGRRGRRH